MVTDGKQPTNSTGVLRIDFVPSELEDEDSIPRPTVLLSVMAELARAAPSMPPDGTRECGTLGCILGLRLCGASSKISISSSLSLLSLDVGSSEPPADLARAVAGESKAKSFPRGDKVLLPLSLHSL